jgi:hypothetical protein
MIEQALRNPSSLPGGEHSHPPQVAFSIYDGTASNGSDHLGRIKSHYENCHLVQPLLQRAQAQNRVGISSGCVLGFKGGESGIQAVQNALAIGKGGLADCKSW